MTKIRGGNGTVTGQLRDWSRPLQARSSDNSACDPAASKRRLVAARGTAPLLLFVVPPLAGFGDPRYARSKGPVIVVFRSDGCEKISRWAFAQCYFGTKGAKACADRGRPAR